MIQPIRQFHYFSTLHHNSWCEFHIFVENSFPKSQTMLIQERSTICIKTCLYIQIPVSKMFQQVLFPIICTLHLFERHSAHRILMNAIIFYAIKEYRIHLTKLI